VPRVRVTYTLIVTKEVEFDKSNYVGVTDYKGDPYPEIDTAYDAVRWERQEDKDPDAAIEHAIEAAAEAKDGEYIIKTAYEVIDDAA
jgi:hypothetical protein